MIKRKITKEVLIGSVRIGNKNPIAVQSMTNTQTSDITSTIRQIRSLQEIGCEIVCGVGGGRSEKSHSSSWYDWES